MKKLYIFIFASVIGFNAKAQLTLTKANNCPVPGTIEIDTYFDSTTTVPKTTGTNKSWNFTSLVTTTASSGTYSYVTASSTPSASSFPSATLATNDGNGSYNYYNSQSAYLDMVGTADVTNNSKETLSNPIRWMVWPFTFGTTNNDNFVGTAQFGTLTVNESGNMNISGTGTGTVTLPGGMKYTNCLQITRTFTYVIGVPFSWTITNTSYEYWSGAFKTPIIALTYISLDDGSSVSPDFQVTVNATANVGIEEQQMDAENFVVFPNPAKEKLSLIFKDNSVAEEIELYDVAGKLILSEKNRNTLDVSELHKGIYVVKIKSKNRNVQKQVIITE